MDRTHTPAVVGAGLVAMGALILLQNFGLLGGAVGLLWAAVFGVAGVWFLVVYRRSPGAWWAAIPGATLLGLAVTVLVGMLLPGAGNVAGALFLGSIGAGFALVYLARRDHWWAIIPSGTLLTLAATAGLSDTLSAETSGAVFFLGLALTFGALARLPSTEGRMRWALIPASVMLAMSVLILLANSQMIAIIVPALLILAGLAMLYRTRMLASHKGGER